MIEQRYVNVQTHPTLPLKIYNYSGRAMIDGVWNEATINCRGLIIESHTNRVIARGMKKFWNVGQSGAVDYPLSTEVKVTSKEDGSLGIGYLYDGIYGVATRGSFISDQALHATELLNSDDYEWLRNAIKWNDGNYTPVVEICYPENRIVLDYKGRDELIPLGGVDNVSGLVVTRTLGPDAATRVSRLMSYGEALALPIPDDEEGYVIDIFGLNGGAIDHLKLKGNFYVFLHGLLTNISGRRIWVQMVAHEFADHSWSDKEMGHLFGHNPEDFKRIDTSKSLMDSISGTPDEFRDWVLKTVTEIRSNVDEEINDATDLADLIRHLEGRERYEAGKHSPMYAQINQYLNSGNLDVIKAQAWKRAYPSGKDLPWITEEV